MLAIIYGDIIVYIIAYVMESITDEEIVKQRTDRYVYQILAYSESSGQYIMFLTGNNIFRYHIYPEYKAKRKDRELPIWYQTIRDYLTDKWKAIVVDGMEADDAISITHYKYPTAIICSKDKDLLQIPGKHYRIPTSITTSRGELKTILPKEAYYKLMIQSLMGDSTDNIVGIPGIGPKKAEQILKGIPIYKMWEVAIEAYESYYDNEGLEKFILNFKLVKLLEIHPEFIIPLPIQINEDEFNAKVDELNE
jgi:5'-3' exonuclease